MTVHSESSNLLNCGLSSTQLDENGIPSLANGEELKRTFDNVSLVVGGENDLGPGTLHLTNSYAFSYGGL
jgi:hypothetical protein